MFPYAGYQIMMSKTLCLIKERQFQHPANDSDENEIFTSTEISEQKKRRKLESPLKNRVKNVIDSDGDSDNSDMFISNIKSLHEFDEKMH